MKDYFFNIFPRGHCETYLPKDQGWPDIALISTNFKTVKKLFEVKTGWKIGHRISCQEDVASDHAYVFVYTNYRALGAYSITK